MTTDSAFADEAALHAVRERRLLIDRLDAWLFRKVSPFIGQRVLEVGCGVGNMAPHLRDRELVLGIDISNESVAQVNGTYAGTCIRAEVCDASSAAMLEFARYRFDSIISVNVLEHIEDDNAALRYWHEVLQPGGRVVLIVPAHQFLYGSMDLPIGHWRRYSVSGLSQQLRDAGFHVLHARTVNPLGALGWFLNGRVLHKRVPPVDQLKLFNALYPVMLALDALSLPFGLSAVAVAQKQ